MSRRRTSHRDTVRFVDNHYIFVLVQHPFVEVFCQDVGVNALKLLTVSLYLSQSLLLLGYRSFNNSLLLLILADLFGQVSRCPSVFDPSNSS